MDNPSKSGGAVDEMMRALDGWNRATTAWRLAVVLAYHSGWNAVTARNQSFAAAISETFQSARVTPATIGNARRELAERGLIGFRHQDGKNYYWILPWHEQAAIRLLSTVTNPYALRLMDSSSLTPLLRTAKEIDDELAPAKPIAIAATDTTPDAHEVNTAVRDLTFAVNRSAARPSNAIAFAVAKRAGFNWLDATPAELLAITDVCKNTAAMKNALADLQKRSLVECQIIDNQYGAQTWLIRILPDSQDAEALDVVRVDAATETASGSLGDDSVAATNNVATVEVNAPDSDPRSPGVIEGGDLHGIIDEGIRRQLSKRLVVSFEGEIVEPHRQGEGKKQGASQSGNDATESNTLPTPNQTTGVGFRPWNLSLPCVQPSLFMDKEGSIEDVAEVLGVTKPTAIRYRDELKIKPLRETGPKNRRQKIYAIDTFKRRVEAEIWEQGGK